MDKFIILIIFIIGILLVLCLISFIRNIAKMNALKVEETTALVEIKSLRIPLIISLTTSPTRLPHCLENLEKMVTNGCIPTDAEIHLNLPRTFGRTGEIYPEVITAHPRIQIYRGFEDEGPATKLLPTLDRLKEKYIQGLVITIDDDIYYEKEVFELHLFFAQLYDYRVVTCFRDLNDPFDVSYHFDKYRMELREMLLPRMASIPLKEAPLPHHFTYFLEGFGSVGYPLARVNPETIRWYIRQDPKCRNSDDLLISMSLHDLQIPIVKMAVNELYHLYTLIKILDFGLQSDALHNVQSHHEKYHTCTKELLKINHDDICTTYI